MQPKHNSVKPGTPAVGIGGRILIVEDEYVVASDLQFILADLATKANTEESTRLATRVQKNLVSHLSSNYKGVKDLGTKEALFYVLLGARMPAILVETSFLSHAEEESRLASEKYQEDVAQAIALGVEDFLGRRQLAKVQVD